MKKYQILSRTWKPFVVHNEKNEQDLKNLETRAKEVKCRKNCRCIDCNITIEKGEIALKTSQWVEGRGYYYRNNYCSKCYTVQHVGDV